jgi:hypothetical protein
MFSAELPSLGTFHNCNTKKGPTTSNERDTQTGDKREEKTEIIRKGRKTRKTRKTRKKRGKGRKTTKNEEKNFFSFCDAGLSTNKKYSSMEEGRKQCVGDGEEEDGWVAKRESVCRPGRSIFGNAFPPSHSRFGWDLSLLILLKLFC